MMRLVSVNVGLPRDIEHAGTVVRTGVYKTAVSGPVWARGVNLEGDGQADLRHHGGAFKAVYAYPVEHYAPWGEELGRTDFAYGQFGENLTVEGLLEDEVRIGDVYRIGSAELQVTQPRIPCYKLAIRMDLQEFPSLLIASERSGFYLRIVREGAVTSGDAITLCERAAEAISVRELYHLRFVDRGNVAGLRRALRAPALAPVWRDDLEKLLRAATDAESR